MWCNCRNSCGCGSNNSRSGSFNLERLLELGELVEALDTLGLISEHSGRNRDRDRDCDCGCNSCSCNF